MNTPWGKADFIEHLGEGVTVVGTPSHGGIKLSPARNAQVDPRYREFAAKWSHGWGDKWYEEDCAALAVVVTFPQLFPHIDEQSLVKYRAMLENVVSD